METTLAINLISSNPKVRGGRPCIAGTGLRVSDVVMSPLYHNQTPDEIDGDIREQIEKARSLKAERIAHGGNLILPG